MSSKLSTQQLNSNAFQNGFEANRKPRLIFSSSSTMSREGMRHFATRQRRRPALEIKSTMQEDFGKIVSFESPA